MYSVVLLAAMTTATENPDCWFRGGCNGCYGACYDTCYGSCYGACYGSCWGCMGACYGCWGGWGQSYGCHGCYGCYGCYGGCYGGYYATVPMAVAPIVPTTPVKPEGIEKPKPDKQSMMPARAKLIVELPSDAKLYIDDQPIKADASTSRHFNTPDLQPGQTFFYMVRVEVMKDGAPQTVSRRVLVRAGEQTTADFRNMQAPSATVAAVK